MKKIFKALCLVVLIGALIVSSSGCSVTLKIKRELLVKKVLKERYDEEFVVTKTWTNRGTSFFALAYPERDKSLLFDGLYKLQEGEPPYTYDHYDQAIIAKQLKEIVQADLEALFGECYINATMMGDSSQITNVEDITIENYAATAKTTRVYFEIGINMDKYIENNLEDEYSTLLKTMSKLNLLGYETTNSIYFLADKNYDIFLQYFKSQNQSSTDFKKIVEACPQIGIPVIDEKSRITVEEYISKRKEISK